MEFLRDNYIWMIIIVIVILMTIIGYIAEKTNFGKKEFSKRKKAEKEDTKELVKEEIKLPEKEKDADTMELKTEPVLVSEPKKEEGPQFDDPITDDMTVFDNTSEVQESLEDLNVPFGEEVASNSEEDLRAPLDSEYTDEVPTVETSEDLTAPFGDTAVEDLNVPLGDAQETESVAADMFPEEDLNVPFGEEVAQNSEVISEEDLNVPFGDTESELKKDDFNLDLPDIDSVKDDVNIDANVEDEDDDIWKF